MRPRYRIRSRDEEPAGLPEPGGPAEPQPRPARSAGPGRDEPRRDRNAAAEAPGCKPLRRHRGAVSSVLRGHSLRTAYADPHRALTRGTTRASSTPTSRRRVSMWRPKTAVAAAGSTWGAVQPTGLPVRVEGRGADVIRFRPGAVARSGLRGEVPRRWRARLPDRRGVQPGTSGTSPRSRSPKVERQAAPPVRRPQADRLFDTLVHYSGGEHLIHHPHFSHRRLGT